MKISILAACFASLAFFDHGAPATRAAADRPAAPRERTLLNDGWRFQKDDPPGTPVDLRYAYRPELKEGQDEVTVADAAPTEAVLQKENASGLRPWILPTGNDFIKDPARRHVRPSGNVGKDVPYVQAAFDDSAWKPVTLPHDWAIAGPFMETGPHGGMGRLPSAGIGWYRRKLDVPASDAGKRLYLEVDGAMSYAAVWLNGQLVGGWPYGYASWRVDLTPYVNFGGENQLALRLDNPPHSSRWYPGGGLYRNVWLLKTPPVHVCQWGTYITSREVSTQSATVDVEVRVDNTSKETVKARIETELFEADARGEKTGRRVAALPVVETTLVAESKTKFKGSTIVTAPKRWGPMPTQKPNRYVAVTSVSCSGQLTDRYETRFGIRALRYEPASGLYVNGEHVPIRGVNLHHDLGALGAAFNVRAAERQLELLQEMGCNAIRMSHNPPAPELLELTDRMGFLVVDEVFDSWYRKKTPLDFHLIFPDWHEQDLRSMIRRDRNSPSVILWSIGNEVGEQYTGEDGANVARTLRAIALDEDPTRPTTTAMNYASPEMPLPAAVDVISLNYQGEGIRFSPEFEGTERIRKPPQYSAFRSRFPDKVIMTSESASSFSSRGVYLFPVTREISDIVRDGRGGDSTTHHVSAYELHAVDFGSSPDKVFATLATHRFVAGHFVWTGWDHLGEPTPYYSSRSSYAGIIDLAGFKKDRFHLYQSQWRPELPIAHLLPHWTWPERVGQVTPVHVFTSGDSAELFLNGRSLGRKTKGSYDVRLRWDEVVYEPGTIEVVAYKNGTKWATDSVSTADDPMRLELRADRPEIAGDGRDLSFVTLRVLDSRGRMVPRAANTITFQVSGPGEIVATDNGDPTSFVPFPSHTRPAFNGLCLAIVRAKPGEAGPITVTATADGLLPSEITIKGLPTLR